MKKRILSILALPVLVLAVGLACNLSGGPTPPRPVPTVPTEVQTLNQTIATAQPDPNTGKLELTVTEAQVTSYIVQHLSDQYSSILENPVVVFQPGQVELYGLVKADTFTANGQVIMTVSVDGQGQPQVNIVSANFGPIPVPAAILSNLSDAVDHSIADSMKDYQSEYRLESITFSTGQATIVIVKK